MRAKVQDGDGDVAYSGIISVDVESWSCSLSRGTTDTVAVCAAKAAGQEPGDEAAATDGRAAATAPEGLALSGYPNPFTGSTSLSFTLQEAGEVTLVVYDLSGREVARLVDGVREAGRHRVRFDASGLPSGAYLCRLTAGETVETRRVVVLN